MSLVSVIIISSAHGRGRLAPEQPACRAGWNL